jgi:hypothetical protein
MLISIRKPLPLVAAQYGRISLRSRDQRERFPQEATRS